MDNTQNNPLDPEGSENRMDKDLISEIFGPDLPKFKTAKKPFRPSIAGTGSGQPRQVGARPASGGPPQARPAMGGQRPGGGNQPRFKNETRHGRPAMGEARQGRPSFPQKRGLTETKPATGGTRQGQPTAGVRQEQPASGQGRPAASEGRFGRSGGRNRFRRTSRPIRRSSGPLPPPRHNLQQSQESFRSSQETKVPCADSAPVWNENTARGKQSHGGSLRIIPLGGLGEVGRNMTLVEYQNSILILDVGFRMPGEDMPGIDYIIPNIEYLKAKKKNIVGIVFTHGHYDHIGAVPYLLEKIWHPGLRMIAGNLTKAIILKRQGDFPGQPQLDIEVATDGTKVKLGPFGVEFFRMNHNIPDNYGFFISTPVGNLIDTSDFKFDNNPVNEAPTDYARLKEIGNRQILLLMSDSTDAEEPGHSLSEKEIFDNLETIFKESKGRIIAATFASLLNRIQQLIFLSEKYGRKIAVDGYTMKINIETCRQLQYIKSKKDTFIQLKEADNYPSDQVTIICTGAQGEADAVLMKIASREHKFIRFKKGDSVIFSSSVIPGNERTVQQLKDDILRQGVRVYHYKMMDIHAGGHAKQEELKEMMRLMHPKFFMPIHGQYSMLVACAGLAESVGIPRENIAITENGQVVTLTQKSITVEKETVPSFYVMVDGLGVGDVGEVVLRDRQVLAEDGMFVIVAVIDRLTGKVKGSPDIISRGFVYLRESKDLLKETRAKTISIIDGATGGGGAVNWSYIKDEIRNKIGDFLFTKTERRPMVLPVVIEV